MIVYECSYCGYLKNKQCYETERVNFGCPRCRGKVFRLKDLNSDKNHYEIKKEIKNV